MKTWICKNACMQNQTSVHFLSAIHWQTPCSLDSHKTSMLFAAHEGKVLIPFYLFVGTYLIDLFCENLKPLNAKRRMLTWLKNTFYKSYKLERNPVLSAPLRWPGPLLWSRAATINLSGCYFSTVLQPGVFHLQSPVPPPFLLLQPGAWAGLVTSVNKSRAQHGGKTKKAARYGKTKKKSSAAGLETRHQLSIKDKKTHDPTTINAGYKKKMHKKNKLLSLTKAETPWGIPRHSKWARAAIRQLIADAVSRTSRAINHRA